MSRGCIRLLAVAAAACVVLAYLVYRFGTGASGEPIHIAVVGPMTGNNAENGRAFVEGAQLCIDEINREGGIDGRRIELDIHDDQNNPGLATEKARIIAEGDEAVAVIGHNYSDCSIAGGAIYAQKGIPAISPSSTAPSVTIGNDWYFRTIFSDSLEGSFIPNYIVRVLGEKRVALIAEHGAYGDELSKIFEKAGAEFGIDVGLRWTFDTSDSSLDEQLETIVRELKASGHDGVVFLAVHANEGVKLVRLIRDGGLENTLVTPNALASGSFSAGFDIYPEERRNPGYYTNGIFVSSPLLLDSADEDGQEFRQLYQSRFEGRDPDWRAAFSHDAALLIVEGIRATGIVGSEETITQDRVAIRDWLAGLNNVDVAIKGVTGFNYFDSNGDSQKPVFLGMYSKRNIISTLTQFQEVPNLRSIRNLKQEIRAGRIVVVNGRHMYSTDVVYVGIDIIDVSDIDLSAQTCKLEFELWFRFQGDADSSDIIFLNAAEEIDLGAPIDQAKIDGLTYLRYRAGGRFKIDYLPADSFERHTVGISFSHRRLTRNNLVFVIDVMGMDLPDSQSYFKQLEKSQVLSSAGGWRILEAQLFQDTIERGTLGDPRFLKQGDSGPKFSQFSSKITIERERLALRRRLPSDTAVSLLVMGLLLISLIVYSSRTKAASRFVQPFVVVNFFAGIAVLIAAEVVIVDGLIETLARYSLQQITRVFDVLWWVVPALYLNHALEYFVWRPLENSADQKIPNIVRRFVAFLIYILTFFAIVAFVYDQKITSLLATSGVIAMIIGLAIQINISNIFSGIALNLERPFKVGDWVRVGDYDEAKVIDMTWRTTRLMLRDCTVLCVPNSIAADSQLVNYHQPDESYELWIYFHVDPSHDPSRVIKITLDALNSHEKVLNDPAPACRFIGYTEWSGEFIAVPMFSGYAKRNVWRGSVMTHLWKELHRAGIRQAVRVQEVHMLKGQKEGLAKSSSPMDILRNVEIFKPLSDDAKAFITEQMQGQSFEAGDVIVEQGTAGDSLFIIVEGSVGVWVKVASGDTIEVDRMGAGTFFGEMALLTGETRTASIKAVTDTFVFEITRDHIAPLIARQPEMSGILSKELTRRTINRESKKSAHETSSIDEEALFSKFLGKIQSFFGVKSDDS